MNDNIKIGSHVTLNDIEQDECRDLAKKRFQENRNNRVTNRKIGPQSDEFTDLNGIGGERSFCNLFKTEFDRTIHKRSAVLNEDCGDTTLPCGRIVDIKTTKYPNGCLLAPKWKGRKPSVDLYALMVGTFPSYVFKGFILGNELLKLGRLRNLGCGDTFAAHQSDLVELESLFEQLTQS